MKRWFNRRWPQRRLCLHRWCWRGQTYQYRCHLHQGSGSVARWTVVAIPRSAALRESAIRADDPQVWRVAVYRWRWVAELVARRRTRNSDRFAGTFDYTVVPGVPTKLRVPNEGKADA